MRLASPVPKKKARIEIIPLIDIMFFLLASFMMVSLSQTHMKGIRVNLPSQTAVPPTTVKDFVSVRVAAGAAFYFDNQFVSDEELGARLLGLVQSNPDIKVSISGEMMAMHGDVIRALDIVRAVGIKKVGYQIRAAQVPGAASSAAPGIPAPPPPPR
jgi:biopolymer transport protein ExbD